MNQQVHRREPTEDDRAKLRKFVGEHLGMVLSSAHTIPIDVAGKRIALRQCWTYFPE